MALIACKECNREVSDQAAACPHCGAPIAAAAAPASTTTGRGWALGCGTVALLFIFLVALNSNSVPTRTAGQIAASPRRCQPTDFLVSKLLVTPRSGYLTLTGTVRNGCDDSYGVRLKWTVYNSDGTVSFSDDFWPASTTNIPPNSDYPFETLNRGPQQRSRYTVVPTEVFRW